MTRRAGTLRSALAVLVAAASMLAALGTTEAPTALADAPTTSHLVPIGPLRLSDTRRSECGCVRVDDATLVVDVAGHPDVPDGAIAAAVTITALPTDVRGHVRVWPSGEPRPTVSTLNTRTDRVVPNSAIVPLGEDGSIALYQLRPGDLVVDLTAVFVPTDEVAAGRFVAMAGRRIADTRDDPERPGGLEPVEVLRVPLPAGIDHDATALVVNVTALGQQRRGHVRVRPAGSPRIETSMLNYDGSALPTAASVIVPVNSDGFDIESLAGGHLAIDLVGWFTGPTSAASSDGLYVPYGPTRVRDTRETLERIQPGGTIEVPSPVPGAAALVTNVTTVFAERRGYVVAHPARTPRPDTSAVNPNYRDHRVANLAITTASDAGIAYYAKGATDLVVDVTGWFTGTPVTATLPAAPNEPRRSRVLVIGDSTLAGLDLYRSSYDAFVGIDAVVDARMCRRLLRTSCRSYTLGVIPNTAVEAIAEAGGRFDVVVIKVGYNDGDDFLDAFDAVVAAARAKGAHTIVWQTYNDYPHNPVIHSLVTSHNQALARLVADPRYRDVVVADWRAYSGDQRHWFWDGIHMVQPGAYGQADFISRFVAFLERRPCPRPWAPGGATHDPCPRPETMGAVPDPVGLY